MGIAIPGKTVFLIETAPCFLSEWHSYMTWGDTYNEIALAIVSLLAMATTGSIEQTFISLSEIDQYHSVLVRVLYIHGAALHFTSLIFDWWTYSDVTWRRKQQWKLAQHWPNCPNLHCCLGYQITDCLLKSLFRLTTTTNQSSTLLALCEGNHR